MAEDTNTATETATISVAEVAERLGISSRTVWRRIEEGALPTVQAAPKPGLAPHTRVTVEALEAYIKAASDVA